MNKYSIQTSLVSFLLSLFFSSICFANFYNSNGVKSELDKRIDSEVLTNTTPPPNDFCENATEGIVGTGTTCCALPDILGCAGPNQVWHKYTPSDLGDIVEITVSNISITGTMSVGLFKGQDCTSFESVDPCLSGDLVETTITCLMGDTIYVLIGSESSECGEYDIAFAELPSQCDLGSECGAAFILSPITNGASICQDACNIAVCNMDCGMSTVWFEVTTDELASEMLIEVESEFTSTITMLRSTCDGLLTIPCGNISTITTPIEANTTYHIGVGISDGDPGNFDLCVSTILQVGQCSEGNLEITRPENPASDPNGPYSPGEKVNFCYSVDFTTDPIGTGNNCQWIQGIVPSLGGGWDQTVCPINDQGPPGADWFNNNEVSYQISTSIFGRSTNCSGDTILISDISGGLGVGTPLPGGWYFTSNGGGGCNNDGNPNTMWGLQAGCGSTTSIEFCFDLQAKSITDCSDACVSDMRVGIFVFADGQTGCWSQNTCAADSPVEFLEGAIDCSSVAVDNDGDGFDDSQDCDDNNDLIFPGADELCDNLDNNCDGQIDEGLQATYFVDNDGDGFGDPNNSVQDCQLNTGFSLNNTDCDDTDPNINENAIDIPNNGIDEDCDGADTISIVDNDGDGYSDEDDCDDNNANINPGATEIPNNTIDEDCDGEAVIIDIDGDGWNSDLDCDDANAAINPAATEVPGNGIDEDCDGIDGPSALDDINKTDISIYPNPTHDKLFIETKQDRLVYELYNINGYLIIADNLQGEIHLGSLANGLYVLKISSLKDGNTITNRVLKI